MRSRLLLFGVRLLLVIVSASGVWITSVQAARVAEPWLFPDTSAYSLDDDGVFRETVLEAATQAVIHEDLDARIAAALEADDIDRALIYVDLAGFLGQSLESATLRAVEDANGWMASSLRTARLCAQGAFYASAENFTAMGCQLGFDVIGVGDVRDLVLETNNYLQGDEVDTLVLGLSIAGLAATFYTVGTAGIMAPIDAGLSVLKFAKKVGHIPLVFARQLSGVFMSILDFSLLRSVWNAGGLTAAVKGLKSGAFFSAAAWRSAASLLTDIGTFQLKGRGLSTAMLALKHAKSAADLSTLKRVVTLFGKHADGLMLVLGRGVLSVSKMAVRSSGKIAVKLGLWLGGAVLSLIALGLSLFGNLAWWFGRRALLRAATTRLT